MEAKTKKNKIMTEAEIDQVTKDTKKKLESQETVKFMILPDGKEKAFRGRINGVLIEIPKGIDQDLPVDIYNFVVDKCDAVRKLDEMTSKMADVNLGKMV